MVGAGWLFQNGLAYFKTGQPVLKRAGPFQNGPAHFETGWPVLQQAKFNILINWADRFQNGLAHLKWAARFKMGQIANRAVTYIAIQ